MTSDQRTADAFASSWNNLPLGSIYTQDQFEDWLRPVEKADVEGKAVLELGCGNGSLLVHMANWSPALLEGVDLGESVRSARINLGRLPVASTWRVTQADMTEFRKADGYDFVYSIGVLHHLTEPKRGLDSVVANTKAGGRFHCWVYAREGNSIIIALVDPIRRIASRLPWWVTKYCLATPLVVPYYLYARAISRFRNRRWVGRLPLYQYSIWISNRNFPFFRHVAFDQLVTPKTTYIRRQTIEEWLKGYRNVDQASTYIEMRNGNSWKFGGRIK